MNLTTKPDAALWADVLTTPMSLAARELGYTVPIAKLMCDPSELRNDERGAVEQFEARTLDYAFQEWEETVEKSRMILAAIAEHRARRALAWARIKSYTDIRDVAKILPHPENSTGRQIAAFYNKHLQTLDEAGVEPEQVARVASREDKVIANAARAISRAEKCHPADTATIREIMDDAELLPANELARKWLNGHDAIPCDRVMLSDGTQIVVFVCRDEEDAATLAKHTARIEAAWGNTVPALAWAYEKYMEG